MAEKKFVFSWISAIFDPGGASSKNEKPLWSWLSPYSYNSVVKNDKIQELLKSFGEAKDFHGLED